MKRVADPIVLISPNHAHRRIELYLFCDEQDGTLHLISLSGGHGRLPSTEKGQGPLPDRDNALYVREAIVRELLHINYLEVPAEQAIWEVYARGLHRQTLLRRHTPVAED